MFGGKALGGGKAGQAAVEQAPFTPPVTIMQQVFALCDYKL